MLMGERVKAFRLERNMTQRELAELAGVHQAAIGFLERGERPRSYQVVKKLAPVLGITNAELVELIFEPESA